MSTLRLVVLGTDAGFATAIRDVFAAQVPGVASETLDPARVKSRPLAEGVVIDARSGAAPSVELVTRLRAMGFAGAIVVVGDDAEDTASALGAAGASRLGTADLAGALVPAVAEQLSRAGSEHAPKVMRARRLVAAGEIALRLQHALNNPLAGILAEAQLLQMDTLTEEQHAALGRIEGLCRRIIELGKSLDGMGERK